MVKFVHFELVRIKGKSCWCCDWCPVLGKRDAVGTAWRERDAVGCLETQCKSDKILPRREISVDHEHVLLLLLLAAVAARCCCCSLLLTLSLRLSQCLSHHTESSEIPEIRKDTVHHQYLRELLSGGL